jgi:hypothetical protein
MHTFITNNKHLLGQPPEGWLATPRPTRAPGSHTSPSSRILNSLQIFMFCRSIVITLAESGGASKQCRKVLTPSPVLKLDLLPFLIFHGCGILLLSCSLVRTSPPKLDLLCPNEDRNSWEVPAHPQGCTYGSSVLHSGKNESMMPRSRFP